MASIEYCIFSDFTVCFFFAFVLFHVFSAQKLLLLPPTQTPVFSKWSSRSEDIARTVKLGQSKRVHSHFISSIAEFMCICILANGLTVFSKWSSRSEDIARTVKTCSFTLYFINN